MTDLENLETTIDFHKMYESDLSIAAYKNSHLCGVKGGKISQNRDQGHGSHVGRGKPTVVHPGRG